MKRPMIVAAMAALVLLAGCGSVTCSPIQYGRAVARPKPSCENGLNPFFDCAAAIRACRGAK